MDNEFSRDTKKTLFFLNLLFTSMLKKKSNSEDSISMDPKMLANISLIYILYILYIYIYFSREIYFENMFLLLVTIVFIEKLKQG